MSSSNSKLAIKEGWVSIVVNVALFVLKYWAGFVTGSVAIIADAWHTLSDSLSSIFVIVGVRISHKPADKEHPFGHGRSELITAILIGSLLAVIAFSFVKEGYGKLMHREMVHYGSIAIVATIVSIIMKEGLAQYAFWIGRKANSQSVIADGWHHRSDAISSVVVLVGILLGRYFWWIDGVLGIIVALLILHAAYQVIKDASGVILGEEPTEELTRTIKTIIQQKGNGDLYPHHFHLHNYIQHKELTFHIRLPNDMRIEAAHEIATSIENDIHGATGIVTTIHIEPHTKKCE